MELECSRITRFILPAVRASVAEDMSNDDYNQQEIARTLGVAQVAVSKYINGKYSKQVKQIKNYIATNKLERPILDHVRESDLKMVHSSINQLCAEIATKKL